MQTRIHPDLAPLPEIQEADSILRSCVHCGFCTAVCPTYQLLGNELDGPRGRIYLIKNLLEEGSMSRQAESHLDRCLTCRACETACPSGVEYGRLLDIGRERLGARRGLLAWGLRQLVPRTSIMSFAMAIGARVRGMLPAVLADKLPRERYRLSPSRPSAAARKVVLLRGCAQRAATPQVADALEDLAGRAGIGVMPLPSEDCCGALEFHLAAQDDARRRMRRLIDSLCAALDAGADTIISSASGCGVTVREYGEIFARDPDYAERAKRVAERTMDAGEFLAGFDIDCEPATLACHVPCTLQHGQKLPGAVEGVLRSAGFTLTEVAEPHLCCGSAGTYVFTQPELSRQLKARKLGHLEAGSPDVIVTANVGCQLHLGSGTETPVRHWLSVVQERLRSIRPR